MKRIKRMIASVVMASGILTGVNAQAEEIAALVEAALVDEQRPAADKERDAARKPGQVLAFLGLKTGMTVIELRAGGGYYSEILSAAVGENGKVYVQNTEAMKERRNGEVAAQLEARMSRFPSAEIVWGEVSDIVVEGGADLAFTALNLHDIYNRSPEAATDLAKEVYAALKPGGVFGVIDHAGSEGQDNRALHRMQETQAKAVLTEAGFEIAETSSLLSNPEDDHTKSIRDESLNRNTDRFLIKAVKPE